MGKIRVYQLAKDLEIENKELLKVIRKLGLEVKSHMSVVDEESAEIIAASIKSTAAETSPTVEAYEEIEEQQTREALFEGNRI